MYFPGVSFRNISEVLILFKDRKLKILKELHDYENGFRDLGPLKFTKNRVSAFIIDETTIQIGNQDFWLSFCIESIHSSVLGIYISYHRNMVVAEKLLD